MSLLSSSIDSVLHLNFRVGSTFPVPVCTVPSSMNRPSRCNKVDSVRLHTSYRLNLLLPKCSGRYKGGYWGKSPPRILGVIAPPPLESWTYIQALNSRGYSTCCLNKLQLPWPLHLKKIHSLLISLHSSVKTSIFMIVKVFAAFCRCLNSYKLWKLFKI